MSATPAPLLTLEPLIEAVRSGVEARGWVASGVQKTTSFEFEGRWAGDSTRSAYLFFHGPGDTPDVSIDVFLDETSRGLSGNLALVVALPDLGRLGDVPAALACLGAVAADSLPQGRATPFTLRLHSASPDTPVEAAGCEARLKLRLPPATLRSGAAAVASLASEAVLGFERILEDPRLVALRAGR